MTDSILMAKAEAKMEKLKERLASEFNPPEEGPTPASFNLDDFMIEAHLRHLYDRANLEEGEDGDLQFVVEIKEWQSASLAYNGKGRDERGVEKNLGRYIEQMSNGPENWIPFNVLPNGSGLGAVVMFRNVKVTLPMPEMVDTNPSLEVPSSEETKEYEDKAAKWASDCLVTPLGAVEGADFVLPDEKEKGE